MSKAAGLRGLFGVDFVLRDGIPWPVEVNPRYTASVEVLEFAAGIRALTLHRSIFAANGSIAVPLVDETTTVLGPDAVFLLFLVPQFPAILARDRVERQDRTKAQVDRAVTLQPLFHGATFLL